MNVTTQEATPTARWLTLRRAIAAAFTAALTVMGLLPLLGATAAGAATAVSSPTISLSSTTTGATAVYTVGFTTSGSSSSPTGALASGTGTIALTAPSGTAFPSTASDYTVNAGSGAVAASTVATGSSGSSVTITTPVNVGGGTTVAVVVAGVTNPGVGTNDSINISTSSDTAPVSTPTYNITSGISNVSLSLSSTLQAATGITYTLGFTTSSGGALAGGSSVIYVNFPAGTGMPNGGANVTDTTGANGTASQYLVQVGGQTAAAKNVTISGTTAAITVPAAINIGNGAKVTVIVEGVANPAEAAATTFSAAGSNPLTVSTSSDTAKAAAPPYTIGTDVTPYMASAWTSTFPAVGTDESTGSTAGNYYSNDAAGATNVTYDISFQATTALASGTGTVTLIAPSGFTIPTAASNYVLQDYTAWNASHASGPATPASTVNVTGTVATLTVPFGISAGDEVNIAISGVTNSTTPGTSYFFLVSTSADTAATVSSGNQLFSIDSVVTGVTVTSSNSLASATGGVTVTSNYTISFTAATNLPAGSDISVCAPEGPGGTNTGGFTTALPSGTSWTIGIGTGTPSVPVAGATSVNAFGATLAGAPANYECQTIVVPADLQGGLGIEAGQSATIEVAGVTNPVDPETTYQFAMATSTDAAYALSTDVAVNAQPTNITYNVTLTALGVVTFTPPTTSGTPVAFYISYPTGTTLPGACTAGTYAAVSSTEIECSVATTAGTPITESGATLPNGNDNVTVVMANGPSTSSNYVVVGGSQANQFSLTSITATPSSQGQPSDYAIVGTTSITGQISGAGGSTLTFTSTEAAGGGIGSCVINGLQAVCGGGNNHMATLTLPAGLSIGSYSQVDVTLVGVTNEASASATTYSGTVTTTADQASSAKTFSVNTFITGLTVSTPLPNGVSETGSQYSFSFTATTALTGGTSTITVVAASGTIFPSSGYTVNSVTASASPSANTVSITVPTALGSVAAASTVDVTISGVTNPSIPSNSDVLEVSTSSDQAPVANVATPYVIATTVSNVVGPVPNPTTASKNSMYTIGFTTSSSGTLMDGNVISVVTGCGTALSAGNVWVSGSTGVSAMAVSRSTGCTAAGNNVGTITLASLPVASPTIPAGSTVWVNIPDSLVVNPTSAGTYGWSMFTAKGGAVTLGDAGAVTGPSYSIGTAVGATTVTLSNDIAGNASTYTISTTATTALVGGTDTVTVAFPSTTTVPSTGSSYLINGVAASTVSVTGTSATVTLPSGTSVGAGGALTVTAFVTNSTATGTFAVMVSTSKDTTPTTSNTFTIYAPAPPSVSSISPNTGATAGGTVVTITGTGFTSSATVSFGAVAGTAVTVTSSSSITATSPAQAAAVVDVTVTTVGGTSAKVAGDQFTYTAPVPTVSAISPASGPASGGTTVTVTGTGLTAATGVSFGTVAATSVTVASDTSLTAAAPAGTGTVDVTVTTAGGTSAKSAADQFTYTSCSAPTVSAIAPTGGPAAGGTSVTITGTNFEVGSGSSATCQASAVNFGSTPAGAGSVIINSATSITAVSPAQAAGTVDVTVTNAGGTSAKSSADQFTYSSTAPGQGYWLVTSQGTVDAYGSAPAITPAGMNLGPNKVVAIATSPGGTGYWLVDSAGNIYTAGTALYYGGPSQLNPNLPAGGSNAAVVTGGIVGIAATADGKGYWEVDGQGDIFTFGDAVYHGTPAQLNPSAPAGGSNSVLPLNSPIVGIVSTGDGQGYWEVGADGGIFTFGDATFQGSMGGVKLAAPVVGMIAFGTNYEMVGADGGVFTFPPGSPIFHGSEHGSLPAGITAVGIAETSTGAGYWIANSSTPAANFGDAQSLTGPAASGVVAIAAS